MLFRSWGTLFPPLSLLVVITVAYSIIAPVMNGFGAVAFMLFYFTYKYNFLYVYDISPTSDTGGLFFPKAIQHIFVGMYLQQVMFSTTFDCDTNLRWKDCTLRLVFPCS